MKKSMLALAGLVIVIGSVVAQDDKAAPKAGDGLKDEKAKVSYVFGLNIGRSFKGQAVDVDPDLVAKGIKDALAGKPQLTDDQCASVMQAFQKKLLVKQNETGEKNTKEGVAFLAANAKKPGVKTLESGLQYKVLKDGTGKIPKASDTVKAHYKGTLIDGTEFDSSYKRGEPSSFPVEGVIAGWTEALQLMKVGSKWELTIPATLAYGERGRPGIPPNSVLVFEVELIGIE